MYSLKHSLGFKSWNETAGAATSSCTGPNMDMVIKYISALLLSKALKKNFVVIVEDDDHDDDNNDDDDESLTFNYVAEKLHGLVNEATFSFVPFCSKSHEIGLNIICMS